jgi:hypothetical protein
MLRSSMMALAALLFAAALLLVPRPASAGYYGGGWYGNWDYYGGRFTVVTHTRLHEYAAYNPNCAFLRRLVPTLVGPQWQVVPVCF